MHHSKLAQRLTALIAASPKSQKEIAAEIGYTRPNIITMFKQGVTRVPINKVGPLAVALDTDPRHLLRLALQEYMPDNLVAIEAHFGTVVTHNELEMLAVIRKASNDADPKLRTREQREQLAQWSGQIAEPSHLVHP